MVFIKVSIIFIVTVGTDISSNFTLFLNTNIYDKHT